MRVKQAVKHFTLLSMIAVGLSACSSTQDIEEQPTQVPVVVEPVIEELEEEEGISTVINNGVIDYIKDNYKEIEDDMNESIRLIRKNTIKTNERKKRQELSLSASRGLNKHHEKIIIDFN